MSTLIVTLPPEPADAATLYDYVLSADGLNVAEQSRAPLALLPLVGNTGEVVALVAARHLSWHQVSLPKGTLARGFFQDGGASRLRAVLDGLLEDRLLDEPQQLHFAIEPAPRPETPIWVAVCDRAWLRAGLLALEQAGRPVSRIVPEFGPDSLDDTLHVLGEPDQAQLVLSSAGGVTVWPLSAASVALLAWPDEKHIVAEPAVAALAEQLFKRNVTLQQEAPRRLQALQSPWDLAQFDLVNSHRARIWKRLSTAAGQWLRAPRWRAARLALVALLLVNLAGLNAWAWREQSMIQSQRAALRELLTRTFPEVKVVVDAPLQMARQVAALQQASGALAPRDLESLLAAVGAAAPNRSVPSAIDYAAGEVRLKGLKLTPEDLSSLSFKLKAQAYASRVEGDSLVVGVATP